MRKVDPPTASALSPPGRIERFLLHTILHVDDPPHRLALGVAIGMFMAFTPTVGFQTLLVVFFAWLLRANKVVGLPLVWITNPATIAPIYYSCYLVGRALTGSPKIGFPWWAALGNPPPGWLAMLKFYWTRLLEVAEPLWVGCLIVSSVAGVASYVAIYGLVRWHRGRRRAELAAGSADES